jgi:dihydroorotate dehydrogenase
MMDLYPLIKTLLFTLDAERAHHLTMQLMQYPRLAARVAHTRDYPQLGRELMGLYFPNPIGLAAGMDKNAEAVDAMAALGFGFVEVGTITPRPQAGNPKPRLFRLPQHQALINRMGFNNVGVIQAAKNLSHRKSNIIIGGNIGKNKDTPIHDAIKDYERCILPLHDYVDYFVINVSSPNTQGLRDLQTRDTLYELLSRVQDINQSQRKSRPLLLKIAPDLDYEQLDAIHAAVMSTHIAGIIATNTTLSRDRLPHYLPSEIARYGDGGLSGTPLTPMAMGVTDYLYSISRGQYLIIGSGGIMSGDDAASRLQAGASLIQLYTGLVYKGPALIAEILDKLAAT